MKSDKTDADVGIVGAIVYVHCTFYALQLQIKKSFKQKRVVIYVQEIDGNSVSMGPLPRGVHSLVRVELVALQRIDITVIVGQMITDGFWSLVFAL